jgi:hypothetical protein
MNGEQREAVESGFIYLPARSANGEVIFVSSPLESSCIFSIWQGSAKAESEVEVGSYVKGAHI